MNEIKVAAAKILSKFKLVETENTEFRMLRNSRVFYNFGEVRMKLDIRQNGMVYLYKCGNKIWFNP